MIGQLYTDNRSIVRHASSLQEEFTLKYGVKQIFALAHDLINSVVGHFMRRLTSQCDIGMKPDRSWLRGRHRRNHFHRRWTTTSLVTTLQVANQVGVTTNWTKTTFMAVIPDSTPPLPLHVLNEHVECVDCFTYLGIDITNNGLSTKYIPNIQTSRVMCRLWNRFFYANDASTQNQTKRVQCTDYFQSSLWRRVTGTDSQRSPPSPCAMLAPLATPLLVTSHHQLLYTRWSRPTRCIFPHSPTPSMSPGTPPAYDLHHPDPSNVWLRPQNSRLATLERTDQDSLVRFSRQWLNHC